MVPVRTRHATAGRGVTIAFVSAMLAMTGSFVPAKAEVKPIAAPPQQHDIAGSKVRTRFVVLLDRTADFQISALQNPNRVVVDLPDVKIHLPTMSGDRPIGLVKSFRGGLAAPGKMRVVIDVTEPVIVEKSVLEPGKHNTPSRLVLDIVPVAARDGAAPRKPLPQASHVGLGTVQPPLPKPAVRPEVRAAKSFRPVIVLDPGHGGHDGGAVRNGTVEKEVVLLFGHALRDKLNATKRYKVLMTRDTDTFIPLEERREFAEKHQAALFIAIHADYAGSTARGATIYSLRDNVANELRRSARGEALNGDIENRIRPADPRDASAIRNILADLQQMEVDVNKQRSSLFARSVIEYMGEQTNMMSNPDRTAAFTVLRTAKVPAVLIELAFVTNREDAAKLKSDEWRSKVAESIQTAIDNYFSHQAANNPYVAVSAPVDEEPTRQAVPRRRR